MKYFLSVLVLMFPVVTYGAISINEVAWMGTHISSHDEWIELVNNSDQTIDISDWVLEALDGSPRILLSGTIHAGEYFLLERTDDDSVPGIVADLIYSGALSNSGETLVLINKEGSEVFRIDGSSGWPAGENGESKHTMQWNGNSWITAVATPRARNASQENAIQNEVENDESAKNNSKNVTSETFSGYSAHMEPVSISAFSQKQDIFLSAGRDRLIPQGAEVYFDARAIDEHGREVNDVAFSWSFGDGTHGSGRTQFHGYLYPGNYVAVVRATYGNVSAVSRATIIVFVPNFELSLQVAGEDFFLQITNRSPHEVNIGQYILGVDEYDFVFPEDTLISAGGSIGIGESVAHMSFHTAEKILLMTQLKKIVGRFEQVHDGGNSTLSSEDMENLNRAIKDAHIKVQEIKNNVQFLERNRAQSQMKASDTRPSEGGIIHTTSEAHSFVDMSSSGLSHSYKEHIGDVILPVIHEDSNKENNVIHIKKPRGIFTRLLNKFFGE